MSSARAQLATTLLTLAAWIAAAWVLVKYFVPAVSKSLKGGGGSGYGGVGQSSVSYGGGVGGPGFGPYRGGAPINSFTFPGLEKTFSDAYHAQTTAGLYNQQHGYNFDGSKLSPAEMDAVTPALNNAGSDASIPDQTYDFSGSNYLDLSPGDPAPDSYMIGDGAALNDGAAVDSGGGDLQYPASPGDVAGYNNTTFQDWWA